MSQPASEFDAIYQTVLANTNREELRRVVKTCLAEDFDALVSDKPFKEQAFELVEWAERQHRLQELADCLRSKAGPEDGDPPYKGLAYFDVADAKLFFGREKLTAELVAYLKTNRFLAVVGASGSGKSSLVRAGVVARLAKGDVFTGSDKWAVFVIAPTAAPLKSLAAALTRDSESVTAAATLIDDMALDPRSIDLYSARIAGNTGAPRVLIVVDQFEEVFTLCSDEAQRKAFIDSLLYAATADGAATIVLTLRADFYAQYAEYENLRTALESHQKYIGAMSPDELRTAIEKPAADGNWILEDGLANRMLKDVADQPGSLPLLSHALLETWKRRSRHLLTFRGYDAAGGVQGAIARTADSVFSELTQDEQDTARRIFIRLTSIGEDGAPDTRRRVQVTELASLANSEAILQKLEDARLVTAARDPQGAVYVEIVHEALIREWPQLGSWLEHDREALRIHRKLTDAAIEWSRLDFDQSVLYRGVRLAQAQSWLDNHEADINSMERKFLEESFDLSERESQERERIAHDRDVARERELEQAKKLARLREQEARQSRRARNGVLAALAAATIALVLALVVGRSYYEQLLLTARAQLLAGIRLEMGSTDRILIDTSEQQADNCEGTDLVTIISDRTVPVVAILETSGYEVTLDGDVNIGAISIPLGQHIATIEGLVYGDQRTVKRSVKIPIPPRTRINYKTELYNKVQTGVAVFEVAGQTHRVPFRFYYDLDLELGEVSNVPCVP